MSGILTHTPLIKAILANELIAGLKMTEEVAACFSMRPV
jgi:hypothetical protein